MTPTITITKDFIKEYEFPFDGVVRCSVRHISDGTLLLEKLEVMSGLQGKGIGKRVLHELKLLGKVIMVYPYNPDRWEDCKRFYRKNGFVEVPSEEFFYWYP